MLGFLHSFSASAALAAGEPRRSSTLRPPNVSRPRARLRPQGIPEQDQPHDEQRCRCGAAAHADARVLRLLRLAFVGARPLAAGAAGADVSRCAICGARTEALRKSLTAENIALRPRICAAKDARASSGRMVWRGCCSCAELREWEDPEAREMLANLQPARGGAVERISKWLPKLSHPIRIGEHAQTAFALGLMLDYARSAERRLREAADRQGTAVLPERHAMPAHLRAGRRRFSLARPRRSGRDAPRASARRIREVAESVPAAAADQREIEWLPVAVSPIRAIQSSRIWTA